MLPNADGRSADRQRVPSQHDDSIEEGGIDVEEARCETLVDRVNTTAHRLARAPRSAARSATTTSTIRSRRSDYYRMLAFFSNVEYTVRPAGRRPLDCEPTLDLPSPEQEAKRRRSGRRLEDAQREAQDRTPELDARAARVGSRRCRARRPRRGQTLTPVAPPPTAATLTKKPDGSVLASGAQPGRDATRVEADASRRARSPASGSKRSPILRCRRAGPAATTTATSCSTGSTSIG